MAGCWNDLDKEKVTKCANLMLEVLKVNNIPYTVCEVFCNHLLLLDLFLHRFNMMLMNGVLSPEDKTSMLQYFADTSLMPGVRCNFVLPLTLLFCIPGSKRENV